MWFGCVSTTPMRLSGKNLHFQKIKVLQRIYSASKETLTWFIEISQYTLTRSWGLTKLETIVTYSEYEPLSLTIFNIHLMGVK